MRNPNTERSPKAATRKQSNSNPKRSFNPWPVSIITFFVVALIGCGALVGFCSRHPADLVSADYYEQEVRYQGQINRTQRAGQLASVRYDPPRHRIVISLAASQADAKTAGRIELYRPSAMNLDRQFKLAPNSEGIQMIDASTLEPGLWKVRVSWTRNHQECFVDQKIVIAAKSS